MSKLQEPLQSFLVTIAVIEGKHYVWPEMTSFVQVKVDRQQKNSAVQFTTDCPYYNEYFVFEFFTTLNELVDKKVTLTVIRPGGILRKRQILGFITFDVGTVWYLPDHQCYHKWAILSAPAKDMVSGTRGYLKLDINVLTKGAFPRVPHDLLNDEIEGNLFLPDGVAVERQKVNFIFTVFRGEHLVKKNQILETTFSKTDQPPAAFIEIIFGGMIIKTSTKKSWNPIWNEKLILPELFPPLSQRFKINLYTDGNKKNPSKYLNLRSIANGKEEGFLPTFGPSFIHFYAKNDLEGYLGKVLISLQTQLISENVPAFPNVEFMPILSEISIVPVREEQFILHATIFEVSSIMHKFQDKVLSFRIACGPLVKEEHSMITLNAKPRNTNKNVCYLDIGEKKPCIFLHLTLPDVRKRVFLHNMLMKTANELKRRLNEIEHLFEVKPTKEARAQSDTMIVETLDFILSATVKYVDMASTFDLTEYTVLDQERLKLSLREMREIHAKITTCYCLKNKKKIFQRIEKTHQQLEILTEELDDWPNIYIWMIYGTKRVGYLVIPAKSVFFSPIPEEKGTNCGVLQTVFLLEPEPDRKYKKKMKSIKFCAKMDLLVWMGVEKHWKEYFKCIPGGFTPEPAPEEPPQWLIAHEKHEFQGLAFIFQGRISPGFDSNSLCDPYIHVIFGGISRQTQIFTNTLNPIWDQALIFPVVLYGSKEFIKTNPPVMLVEIYDQDTCNTSEMVGRSTVKPVIRLKDDVLPNSKLQWHPVENSFKLTAEILAAFELTEEGNAELGSPRSHNTIVKIPQHIKPHLVNHRIEVMFWGVRHLKKVQMLHINRPKIVLECVYTTLHSDPLQSAKKNLNFPSPVKIFETIIAQEIEYARCITMKMFDCRSFGISVYAGTHIAPMSNFFFQPLTSEERQRKFEKWDQTRFDDSMSDTFESIISSLHCKELKKHQKSRGMTLERLIKMCCKCICFKRQKSVKIKYEEDNAYNEEKDFDWWTKFYASTDQFNQDSSTTFKYKLIVYETELEAQTQFHNFNDMLFSFPMYKGKKTGDETLDDANTMGVFKGSLKIYQWPPVADYVTNSGLPLEKGVFQDFPPNNPLRYVLRVYCVRALNLRPKDSGKSDPYLFLTLNDKTINDKDNVVYKQLNPIFGRCFEFSGIFPEDHTLVIGVYDLDLWTNDDLIGETKIDVENRFYSRHRAHCGLAQDYKTEGHCEWRDYQKPASILFDLCRRWNLPDPEYTKTSVRISGKDFTIKKFKPSKDTEYDRQVLSLAALRRWQEVPVVGCALVPEHVETRSLYHPYSPGLEQGKLQIWIDIFPVSDLPAPKAVNIEPRKPVDYELRVIVWNCEGIIMNEDDFFSGQQKSDVYVKGWVISPQESQSTDVHYRSLSGEANFNWRFIFTFSYLSTENKIVYREDNAFQFDSEVKIPCTVTLQVWDYDAFQIDDFLASLTLDLTHLPRAAHEAKLCKLSMLQPSAPTVNLFKIKRTRGWWPLRRFDESKKKQTLGGSIELEFELMRLEDAEKNPSGIGREAPQPLPPPNRPETSFSLFSNPFKTAKYLVRMNKWRIIKVLIIVMLVFSTIASFVAFPSAVIHRIIG